MFDLPMVTPPDRREYNKFRKSLIKGGFVMMQESIYCKLAQNQLAANAVISYVKKIKPTQGIVQVLTITEKQYSNIVMVVGRNNSDVITSSDRTVVI